MMRNDILKEVRQLGYKLDLTAPALKALMLANTGRDTIKELTEEDLENVKAALEAKVASLDVKSDELSGTECEGGEMK